MATKVMNLVMLYNTDRILLAMKKRGFGAGRYNGYGGKVHDGETVIQAALRELQEEAGISGVAIAPAGMITFVFPDDKRLEVHLFRNDHFSGEASETEEMKPQWFSREDILYARMWPDDIIWLPIFLQGKNITGSVWFRDEQTILRHDLRVAE